MKRSTIKDVAELAGVSVSTVSRVINGYQNVNSDLKDQVHSAMQSLNFFPNAAARSIRGSGVSSLGVILPNVRDLFYAQIADDLIESARQRGQSVVIATALPANNLYNDRSSIEFLSQIPLDGVICFPSMNLDHEFLESSFHNTPIVIGGRHDILPGKVHVYPDYIMGGKLVTRHLLSMGHTRIACFVGMWTQVIGSMRELDSFIAENSLGAYPGIEQFLGYRQALEEVGVDYDPSLVDCILYEDGSVNGYRAAQRLFSTNSGIDAVFAANDLSAAGALQFLIEQRLRVPEEVSLFGYDNSIIATLTQPKLSSVDHNMDSIGSVCVDMINRLIDNESCEDIKLDVKLVLRQSCCSHKKN